MGLPNGLLAGVRVLDLTRMVAGPLAAQVLGDLGATVFKVERPIRGDDTRAMGPFLHDAQGNQTTDSPYFFAYNRGKRSVTVDISTPEGARIVRELAASCDVLIENYKVGALHKYGLSYEDLRETLPRLVYCSITAFGMDGPYAPRPGYDSITQGMAGLMSTNGPAPDLAGSEPLRTSVPITDVVTGLYAVNATLAALHRRAQTGQGAHVDVSLFDASVSVNGPLAVEYLLNGRVPQRNGNANPLSAPSESFDCSDGKVMVAIGNNSQFDSLCEGLGLPCLREQPRFATGWERARHRPELHALLEARTRTYTVAGLIEHLNRFNVPVGGILSLDQVFADPQVQHRGLAVFVPHRHAQQVPVLRSPIRVGGAPLPAGSPPALGEHTDAVLAEELGFSARQIAELRESGTI